MKLKVRHLHLTCWLSVWLVLSFAAGLRWLGYDRDYDNYLNFYQSISSDFFIFIQTRFEHGFIFLAWISYNLANLEFSLFLVLLAAIALAIKIYLFYRHPYAWILLIAYIPNLYLLHEMTQIRAAIAIAFVYLAIESRFSVENSDSNRLLSVAVFLVGLSFHVSVFIFIPFLLLPKSIIFSKKLLSFKSIFLVVSLVISLSIFINFFELFSGFFEKINPLFYIYNLKDEELNYFSLRIILSFFMTCIGIIVYRDSKETTKIYTTIGIYGFILLLFTAKTPVYAHRIFEMCGFSYFLWVTSVPRIYAIPATSLLMITGIYLGYRQLFIDPLFH